MTAPDPMPQIEAALDKVEIACCNNYTTELRLRRTTRAKLEEAREVLLALIRSAIAQRTRQVEQDVRTSFERWMSDEGRFPRAVERRGNGYTLLQSNTCWDAWEAAARVFLASPTPPTPAPDEAGVLAEWQPIETAPKNMEVLCYHPKSGMRMFLPPLMRVGYVSDWSNRPPTHWMPLPNPPGYRAALLGDKQ